MKRKEPNTNRARGFSMMPRNGTRPDKRDLLKKRRTGPPVPPGGAKPPGKPGWPLGHRVAFIILIVMLGFFLWKQMNTQTSGFATVTYTDFQRYMNEEKLESARIQDGTLLGTFKQEQTIVDKSGQSGSFEGIKVEVGSYDQAFLKELVGHGVDVKIEPERTWMNILISTLPWILIFGIWLFILRQMQGGPKGVFTFGKSKAKLMAENQPKVTFKDVAGVEEAKQELEEIIEFLKDPHKFQRLGGKIPKGALLVGPPGTGKTLLARAVAGEAGVPFFSMSGSDFVEMFVGVGASRVRDLFEQGKSNAPCIIFIDEIDAVGRQRGAGIGGGHDEREQTLNQLLVEMDGFESNEGVILLAATNRPDVLDPALLRPGRFDRQIVVDWPDVKAREMILKVHAKKIQVDPKIDMEKIARGTPGMTGADLANVVNEAALLAARLNRNKVTMADFEEAKDKVMMGAARKSMVINEDEKRLTAYHEAGHVLVAKFVKNADPVHKVSIIARGRALGLTHFLPTDEKHNWSYNYCLGKLTVLLGGRAAEIFKFDDVTNGAANDIENATRLAHKMVCEWGMSSRLGPLTFGKKESEIFLGREIATHKDYSEETSVAIDQEVKKFVETAQQEAESIIRDHPEQLEALTEALLKKEVLDGDEIERIVKGDDSGRKSSRSSRRRRRSSSRRKKDQQGDGGGGDTTASDAKKSPGDDGTSDKDAGKTTKSAGDSDGGGGKDDSSSDSSRPKRKSSRRRPRRKKRDSSDGDGGSKNDSGGSKKDDSSSDGKSGSNKKDDKKNDSDNSGGSSKKRKRKPRDSRKSKSRIVRLKTGGRQRFIRKAPAKKIREIN